MHMPGIVPPLYLLMSHDYWSASDRVAIANPSSAAWSSGLSEQIAAEKTDLQIVLKAKFRTSG